MNRTASAEIRYAASAHRESAREWAELISAHRELRRFVTRVKNLAATKTLWLNMKVIKAKSALMIKIARADHLHNSLRKNA